MEDHIYKTIEITGTSHDSVEDAVNRAIGKAGKTIQNLRWFTIKEVRGAIEKNQVAQWQVTVKASFTIKD
ncbi:MAG: dodecin [Oceanipulchritudo sp.]